MRLRILSDLHLEGYKFTYIPQDEDVVLLLGDIHTQNRHAVILDQIPSSKKVIMISGNHEYYGQTFENVDSVLTDLEDVYPNFTYLNNSSVDIDNISFFGGCMWSNFQLYGIVQESQARAEAKHFIADYKYIDKFASYPNYTGIKEKWTINDTIEQYELFNKEFDRWVKDAEGKTRICLSHFLPSEKSVSPQFANSVLNAYFCSNQEHRIQLVDYWLHGHTHSSANYKIGDSTVICNPHGYGRENVNEFDPNLIIEVL